MKWSALCLVAIAAATATNAFAQNAAPVATDPLPEVTLYTNGPNRSIDLTSAFRDQDFTPALRMTTVFGAVDWALFERQKPITTANFLRYVDEGRYFKADPTTQQQASSFIHRSIPDFVLQGGGFIGTVDPTNTGIQPTEVATLPPIQNEPGISNTRATIAMAKLGTDVNSATSQWFVNLKDNSANLDTQNGGFAVFATVIGNGMDVFDRIANVPIYDYGNVDSNFRSFPLREFDGTDVEVKNLVSIPAIQRIDPVPSPLTFTASSDNAAVVVATISGRNLLISGKAAGTAHVTVTAKDADGATVSQTFTANVTPAPGRLVNISTRARVGTGDDAMIGGFIMRGETPKRILIRALGPTLSENNVSGSLPNPQLDLYDRAGVLIASNNDWSDANKQAIVDTGIPPKYATESAILVTLPSSNDGTAYTAIVRGLSDTTGVGLVEVYDLDAGPGSTLLNISTRARVGTTGNVALIGGFLVGGTDAKRILIRAIGPSLPGVSGTLEDPTVQLVNSNGTEIDVNNDWATDDKAAEIAASGIAPTNPKESAMLNTLAAGAYTAIVRSNTGASGVASVEAYQLP